MAKTSFMGSVIEGAAGAVKGAIGLGLLGAAIGAIVGVALGGFGLMGVPSIIAGLGTGAMTGGIMGANAGSFLGAITGIVKSREANAPEAQDVVNVAKISFAQGVQVGQQHGAEIAHSHSPHAERIAAERAQKLSHQIG